MTGADANRPPPGDAETERMVEADSCSINRAVDRHGIHEIQGPLMVGGVGFLTPSTGMFRDVTVRRELSSNQRFEAYMQFREQAFKVFATELVSASKYPADLVAFTHQDGERFRNDYWFNHILFHDDSHHFIDDDPSKVDGVDNNSTSSVTAGDQSGLIDDYKENKESRLQKLHYTRRYFAYRKGLLKLDINQLSNDPKKAVEWLKSSTGWSELLDEELRRGLKSHMDFMKEQETGNINNGSIDKSENIASDRINAELASALEKRLDCSDWTALMNHHFNRTKLRNLAKVCSIQAQETGVVLVKQALPVREICKEQILSTSPWVVKEHTVKQSIEGFIKQTVKQSVKDTSKINGNNIELVYDPEGGMSAEEHKWHCSQAGKIHQRVPEALHKVQAEAEKVRLHFLDDPDALKIWDEYVDDINCAASRNLTYSLSLYAQKSALYEQLMRTKARSNTSVSMLSGGYAVGVLSRGYEKLKRATRNKMAPMAAIVGVGVAAFVAGVAVGGRKELESKKN